VNIAIIGGALSSTSALPEGAHPSALIVRNLTATRYDIEIPAGEKQSLPYSFATDLNPQDLRLNLVAVLSSKEGVIYQVQAYNETVSVVEAPISVFDPQVYAFPSNHFFAICKANSVFTASSSTSYLPASLVASSTSSTRPGSKPSSHKQSAEEKAASVPSVHLVVPKRLLLLKIRFP
jgi:hypothetical protein